jgi:predicted metal-dependent hydrolase
VRSSSSGPVHCERVRIDLGERCAIAELRRTGRKVLRIDVKPSGSVVVFAPVAADLEQITERANRKGPWIFRQIDRIRNQSSETPMRYFVSGETHLLLGRQYRLSLHEGNKDGVYVEGSRLNIVTPNTDDQAHCSHILSNFYRAIAKHAFSERLDAVLPPFARRGLDRPPLFVRRMTKRWGSYTSNGCILLNLDLVRASPMLIDYVITHELAHAFYPDHGREWRKFLHSIMPDWESRKARLERSLR